ncbi:MULTISPECIES: M50 family metallopeptidase [unclassified Streptomyces]|uniref:M50 family metallopeptidase n=1 Tax=unclassified Streptomyces TaxID=2593676 RepID=UPI000379655E|nr:MULTISPECIES: M50 family metallopeptidase [unclassified Streptomyces]MYY02709.1 peptidase M50 [Streptomyces sp. SID4913]
MNPATDRARAAARAYRPALGPGVLISPPLLRGPRTVYLLKHPVSGAAFEVGPKEHFLISRLDGTRTLDDLAPAYAERFGRRLAEEHWNRLLGLLGTRSLLAGAPDPPPAAPAPARTGGFWAGTRLLVADADATTARLHRVLRPLLHRAVQLPLLAAVLVTVVALVLNAGELLDGTARLVREPAALVAVALFLWFSITLHELAHGIAAQHYGGRVTEIGLRWRLPAAMLYCTVDNYLFIPGLRARLVIAGAGAHLNMVLLLPFALWWSLLPHGDPTRALLAGLLLLGAVQGLSNLVPLPPLDGYRMLGHLLGTARLAPETRTYLALRRSDAGAAAAYPRRARRLYTAYAAGFAVLVLLAAAGTCTAAYLLLTG